MIVVKAKQSKLQEAKDFVVKYEKPIIFLTGTIAGGLVFHKVNKLLHTPVVFNDGESIRKLTSGIATLNDDFKDARIFFRIFNRNVFGKVCNEQIIVLNPNDALEVAKHVAECVREIGEANK